MSIKKLLSIVMAVTMVLGLMSFPAFSAESTHSKLTHLTGDALIQTDVPIRSFSDLNRLFDGDSTASHANTTPAQSPDGNGLFGDRWMNAGETNYIIIDLGGVYDLSQVNTYWGWAPRSNPNWNNWEYDVPSSYTIYVSDTKAGLETASPAQTVTGLSKDSKFLADSVATVSATGRYVKIVSTCVGGYYALRELEFVGVQKPAITLMGANIRLEEEGLSAGLRFGAMVDKEMLGIEGEWEYDPDSDLEFGMYLLPENKLAVGQTLANYLKNGGQEALKVVAKKILAQDENSITYTAVLTDIPEDNFDRKIVAVPYVTANGETTYYNENTKSYVDVAKAAIASYENGNPNNISSDQYDALKLIVGDVQPDVPSANPVNIGVVSASVTTATGSGDNYIIDGDYNTMYVSNSLLGPDGNPVFSVEFDLGAEYELTQLIWITDCGALKNGTLYGTNDLNGVWTPIATFNELQYIWDGSYNWKGYNVQAINSYGATYRYVKIDVTTIHSLDNEGDGAWDDPNFVEINEVEFMGIPTTTVEPSVTYYDIDAAPGASSYNGRNRDASSLFVLPAGYTGFKINGTYKVNADTLRMLTTVNCIGNGTISYKDYNNFTQYISSKSYGDGHGTHCYGEQIVSAPVSKLSDPVYMSMVLPSEGSTYQNVLNPSDPRNNGNNMHKVCTISGCTQCAKVEYIRLNALGAFYLNQDKKDELSNYQDVQFKLCLGNIRLLVNTASGGWQQVKLDATPTSGNGSLYCLPWSLEWNSATSQTYLDSCKSLTNVSRKTNYSEIPLTVGDFFFTKTFQGTNGQWYTIDERVLHFWGSQYNISNDDDILGIIASYDMWIEYDESIGIKLEDYFISSIGADWRYSNGNGGTITRQAFAGYKHAVSTEKITVFGHNIGPSSYDSLMPTSALNSVKNILGIN